MVRLLLKLRWLSVVIALLSAINAIAFIVIGLMRGYAGYRLLAQGISWSGGEVPAEAPGVQLGRSVDAFLMAMVFFVFSVGVTTLFAARGGSHDLDAVPEWMRVRDLSHLKFLIWEAILAALVVASVEGLVVPASAVTWTALILPIAVLILAAGLLLARQAH